MSESAPVVGVDGKAGSIESELEDGPQKSISDSSSPTSTNPQSSSSGVIATSLASGEVKDNVVEVAGGSGRQQTRKNPSQRRSLVAGELRKTSEQLIDPSYANSQNCYEEVLVEDDDDADVEDYDDEEVLVEDDDEDGEDVVLEEVSHDEEDDDVIEEEVLDDSGYVDGYDEEVVVDDDHTFIRSENNDDLGDPVKIVQTVQQPDTSDTSARDDKGIDTAVDSMQQNQLSSQLSSQQASQQTSQQTSQQQSINDENEKTGIATDTTKGVTQISNKGNTNNLETNSDLNNNTNHESVEEYVVEEASLYDPTMTTAWTVQDDMETVFTEETIITATTAFGTGTATQQPPLPSLQQDESTKPNEEKILIKTDSQLAETEETVSAETTTTTDEKNPMRQISPNDAAVDTSVTSTRNAHPDTSANFAHSASSTLDAMAEQESEKFTVGHDPPSTQSVGIDKLDPAGIDPSETDATVVTPAGFQSGNTSTNSGYSGDSVIAADHQQRQQKIDQPYQQQHDPLQSSKNTNQRELENKAPSTSPIPSTNMPDSKHNINEELYDDEEPPPIRPVRPTSSTSATHITIDTLTEDDAGQLRTAHDNNIDSIKCSTNIDGVNENSEECPQKSTTSSIENKSPLRFGRLFSLNSTSNSKRRSSRPYDERTERDEPTDEEGYGRMTESASLSSKQDGYNQHKAKIGVAPALRTLYTTTTTNNNTKIIDHITPPSQSSTPSPISPNVFDSSYDREAHYIPTKKSSNLSLDSSKARLKSMSSSPNAVHAAGFVGGVDPTANDTTSPDVQSTHSKPDPPITSTIWTSTTITPVNDSAIPDNRDNIEATEDKVSEVGPSSLSPRTVAFVDDTFQQKQQPKQKQEHNKNYRKKDHIGAVSDSMTAENCASVPLSTPSVNEKSVNESSTINVPNTPPLLAVPSETSNVITENLSSNRRKVNKIQESAMVGAAATTVDNASSPHPTSTELSTNSVPKEEPKSSKDMLSAVEYPSTSSKRSERKTSVDQSYQHRQQQQQQPVIVNSDTDDSSSTHSAAPRRCASHYVFIFCLLVLTLAVALPLTLIMGRNDNNDRDIVIPPFPPTMAPFKNSLPTLSPQPPLSPKDMWVPIFANVTGPPGSNFGSAVAVDGNYVVVGAPLSPEDDVNSNNKNGSLTSFLYSNGQWQLLNELVGPESDAQFGYSVDISNGIMVVGTPFRSSANSNNDSSVNFIKTGSVSCYMHSVNMESISSRLLQNIGTWIQLGPELRGDEDVYAANEEFGHAVAIASDNVSGLTLLAVGAPRSSSTKGSSDVLLERGRVYTFSGGQSGTDNDSNFTWDAVDTNSSVLIGTSPSDWFGYSLDVSKDGFRVLVGAPGDGTSVAQGGGYIRLLRWSGTEWYIESEQFGVAPGDAFGTTVQMLTYSGDRFAVGSPGYANGSGKITVFAVQSTTRALNAISANKASKDNIRTRTLQDYASKVIQLGPAIVGKGSGDRLGDVGSLSGGSPVSSTEDTHTTTIVFTTSSGVVNTLTYVNDDQQPQTSGGVWSPSVENIDVGEGKAVLGYSSNPDSGSIPVLVVGFPALSSLSGFEVNSVTTSSLVPTLVVTDGKENTTVPFPLLSTAPMVASTSTYQPTRFPAIVDSMTSAPFSLSVPVTLVPSTTTLSATSLPAPAFSVTPMLPPTFTPPTLVPSTSLTTESKTFLPTMSSVTWKIAGESFASQGSDIGYGSSVAISPNILVIGAPLTQSSGSVFVHDYDDTVEVWANTPSIQLLGLRIGDRFGESVAITDDEMIVIGAPLVLVNGTTTPAGAVYFYRKVDTTWTNFATIMGDPGVNSANEDFGSDVAISSMTRTIVVGAPKSSIDFLSERGRVYVFQYNESAMTWTLDFDTVGTAAGVHFGKAVDVSKNGRVVITGAPDADTGYVMVFERAIASDSWVEVFSLTGDNLGEGFGSSVKFLSDDGAIFAVGAPKYDNDSGRVVFYIKDGTSYVPLGGTIVGSPGDMIGSSRLLTGSGGKYLDTIKVFISTNGGDVRRYTYSSSNSTWVQEDATINTGIGLNPKQLACMVDSTESFAIGGNDNTLVYNRLVTSVSF